MLAHRGRERRFLLFWAGQTLSGFGDAFALVALPLLALQTTGSVSAMGLISASGVVAQVVAGAFSGSLVDRVDRRAVMIACDSGRAVVYVAVPLWWALDGPSLALLHVVAIAGGALANVASVAYMTAIPALVGPERLHSANARLQGALALAHVLGTTVAAALCGRAGPSWALLVDAASFLLSIATLAVIRFDPPAGHGAARARALRFGAGVRFVARHPTLRALTGFMVLLALTSNIEVGAGLTDLIVFHLEHELALGHRVVGACLGTAALGAAVGAAAAPGLARRVGAGRSILAGTVIQSVGLFAICGAGGVGAIAATVGGFLWGAGMMMRTVPLASVRQSAVPPELLGRVTAVAWIAVSGASAVGTVFVTRIAASAGAGATLAGIGVVVGLIALAGAALPGLRDIPPARRPWAVSPADDLVAPARAGQAEDASLIAPRERR